MYTLAGTPVLDARLFLPRVGAWSLTARVELATVPTGAVTFVGGGLTLKGTIVRARAWKGGVEALVVGGASGLARLLVPKAFRGATVKVVLQDTLGAAGEALSSTSDAALLGATLEAWVRIAGSAGATLAQLAADRAAVWRVLADGTVWFGAETWPELVTAAELVEAEPARAREVVWTERLQLRPGVTFRGRRVERVEHLLEARRVRSVVCYG